MKQANKILPFIFVLLSTNACRDSQLPPPLEFRGYEGNPVLRPGDPGSWDDLYVINAFELEYQDTIFMFYTAYNQKGSRALGLAMSADGYRFEKFRGNPILTGDGTGYDAFGVAQAQVFNEGFGMYCNGSSRYAYSRDGIHWEKHRGKPPYSLEKDPWYVKAANNSDFGIQGSKFVFRDSLCLMYYDYGHCVNSAISVAVGR